MIFGKGAGPVHANALRVRAQMAPSGQAVAAAAADHVAFAADNLARMKIVDIRAHPTISPTNSCPITIGTGMVARAHSSHS